MSRTYAQHQQDLMPGALRGDYGLAWARAQGTLKDRLVTRARQSVYLGGAVDPKGRGHQAPDDALARLGADVVIERAPGEALADYRARIAGAWESWSWVGTKYGIGTAIGLLGFGYPSVWGYRELPPDADATRWARVIIIFRGLPAWDAGAVWDGEDTWDSLRSADGAETADPDELRSAMRRVARQWVNARDIVDRVTVTFGGLLWDLDALWDSEEVWDEGDGELAWSAPEWDTEETGVEWDSALAAWDAFC